MQPHLSLIPALAQYGKTESGLAITRANGKHRMDIGTALLEGCVRLCEQLRACPNQAICGLQLGKWRVGKSREQVATGTR